MRSKRINVSEEGFHADITARTKKILFYILRYFACNVHQVFTSRIKIE